MTPLVRTSLAVFPALAMVLACGGEKTVDGGIPLATVERRDIVVDVEATGVVEPINVIEVKSKSSGQIVRMPVETGSQVRSRDLLVQLDTRDVQNQYDQAAADVRAAEARLEVAAAQKRRADELHESRIITAQEHETAQLEFANAQAQVVRARTSLDIAQQRLEDATVRAPVAGTVIEKLVSLGQVIASATSSASGGTTLLRMADLNRVRVRALVNETDIGNVRPGQVVTVTVDAYPDRPFTGVVEKIEPQAVVQQNVTMFPVLVSLQNEGGLLMPGMNGEVAIQVERRLDVVAVPNDAVRSPREAFTVAPALGISQDSMRALMASLRGGRPGAGAGAGPGRVSSASGTDVVLASFQEPQQAPRVEVTAAQCAAVSAALARDPSARRQLDSLTRGMVAGSIDRAAGRQAARAIYDRLELEPRTAFACMRREAAGGRQAAAPQGDTAAARSGGADGGPRFRMGPSEGGATPRARGRPGVVFVAENGGFSPRMVMLGVSDFDHTEILRGVEVGQEVALLGVAAIQAERDERNERIRSRMGIPGMQRTGQQ